MDAELRFVGAEKLSGPAGSLAGVELCSRDNETVGTIDGVLVDPPARRVRFFVVKLADRSTHGLLPVETPVHMESQPRVARIESARADLTLEPYEPEDAPPFSDEDLLAALFPRSAA